MKKLLIAIAAIALFVSCSKSDIAYNEPAEIAITPVQKNMTKSVVPGQTFPANESFNVFAWYNQVAAGTSAESWNKSTDTEYIKESPFVQRDATTWGGQTPYYWPKLGSLLFAGYYPTSIASAVTADVNIMTINDIEQRWVERSGTDEDIMYFNTTNISYAAGPVSVTFKHALSWLTVRLSRANDGIAVNNGYPKIVVNEVKFTNVVKKGTGTVTGQETIAWTPSTVKSDITVNLTSTDPFTSVQKVELNNQIKILQEPLVIPQVFTDDMELVVNYSVYSSENEYFTETYTQKLKGMASSDKDVNNQAITIDKWDPAKHYIYNITIGIAEILIKPEVDSWTPITVEVPVQ